MSRYLEFKAANEEIEALEKWQNQPSGPNDDVVVTRLLAPLVESRIAALKALFDDPAPVPVEPVKPKAKRGDVDGAVKEQLVALAENGSGPEHIDWPTWAHERKLNRKSVLAAVRRHTEKNKT